MLRDGVRIAMMAVSLGCLVAGCGSGSKSPGGAAAPTSRAHQPAKPADNLVGALPVGKNTNVPLQVKFDLQRRPSAGEPVDVVLVIRPTAATVQRVSGTVTADEGLEIVEGAQIPAVERPADGSDIRHPVKLLPKQDGIYTFSAVLTVDVAGHPTTATFSMPLIAAAVAAPAGKTAPEVPPPATATPTAAAQPAKP